MASKVYLVLVCGLPTLGFPPQTKETLESLFETRFPQYRAIVFDTIQTGGRLKFPSKWIQQMASQLLALLKDELTKDSDFADKDEGSLVFLSQNIGGWVVKQALLRAINEPHYYEIATKTRATIFFGTPHRSSIHDDWETLLMKLVLASSVKIPDPPRIIQDAPDFIEYITLGFNAIRNSFYVANYFETQMVKAINGRHDIIFDEYTSTLDLSTGQNIGLPCTHPEMWHFDDGDPKTDEVWLLIDRVVKDTQPIDAEYKTFFTSLLQYDTGLYQIYRPLTGRVASMEWFSENGCYKKFLDCPTSSFLNLQCKPGSGTTTLCSYIMSSLRTDAATANAPILSFSSSNQYLRSQRPEVLYISLSRQLLTAMPQLFRRTAPLCKWILEQSLLTSAETTFALFKSLISAYPPGETIFCFITGFEHSDKLWERIMCDIMSIHCGRSAAPSIKFILANCLSPDFSPQATRNNRKDDIGDNIWSTSMTEYKDSYMVLDLSQQLEMATAVKDSVRRILWQKAHQSIFWAKYEDKIMTTLFPETQTDTHHAYLVAVQKLQLLQTPTFRSSEKDIKSRLDFLPRNIDTQQSLHLIYKKLLQHVNQFERGALEFVATAVRPLAARELAVLVALDLDSDGAPPTVEDLNMRVPCDVIWDLSGQHGIRHLITVAGTRIVPIHGSLAHYVASSDTHFAFLKACLVYLEVIHGRVVSLMKSRGKNLKVDLKTSVAKMVASDIRDEVDHGALVRYATCYWFEHYKQCGERDVCDGPVLQFLQNLQLVDTWLTLLRLFNRRQLSGMGNNEPSPLVLASGLGLGRIVRKLLPPKENHAEDDKGSEYDEALRLAARNGSIVTINELQPFSSRDDALRDAFGIAAEMGHTSLLEHLVMIAPVDDIKAIIDNEDSLGFTPLMRALRGGHFALAELLLQKGADVNTTTRDGSTAMHLLTRIGHSPLIQKVLHGDMVCPYVGTTDSMGYSCFHIAAQSGFDQVVRLYLDNGARSLVNTPIKDSCQTPLYLAVKYGWYEAAAILLERGADPRLETETAFRPLYVACKAGFVSLVELLLRPSSDSSTTYPQSFPEANACIRIAAQEGHVDVVSLLIELAANIDPDDVDCKGETALHPAASQGHPEIVGILIENSFQVNAKNMAGMTALQLAAREGHIRAVKTLVINGADVNYSSSSDEESQGNKDDHSQWQPLELAARFGHVEVVLFLLDHMAQPTRRGFDLATMNGHARVLGALNRAIQARDGLPGHDSDQLAISATVTVVEKGFVGAVNELLTADLSQKIRDQRRHFLLHLAAKMGHEKIVRLLKRKEFSCDEKDNDKNTALHIASMHEQLLCIDVLVELGASKDPRNKDEETPLYLATKEGRAKAVKRLLEHGAQINLRCGSLDSTLDSTALYRACYKGHYEVVKVLLDEGADVTIRGAQGWTVLHATSDNKRVAELLLKKHPELVSMKNDYKSTALVIAAQQGEDEVVLLLLQYGAKPNEQNKSGSSALHRAATEGHESTVKLLVEPPWNAKPDITKIDGATPLHMAAFHGHLTVVQYLVDKVPNINVDSAAYGSPLCAAIISAGNNQRLSFWGFRIDHVDAGQKERKWGAIVRYLLQECGADPNTTGGPYHSPLQAAAGFGDREMVELLLGHEADPNAVGGDENGTPLLAAIRGDHEKVVEMLLDNSANPDLGFRGKLPLEEAFRKDSVRIVDNMLAQPPQSTDVTERDNSTCEDGSTIRPVVTGRKLPNIEVPFGDGRTAIWHAVRKGLAGVVERLVSMGARLKSDKPPGQTLLTYAISCGADSPVVDFLLTLAAKPEAINRTASDNNNNNNNNNNNSPKSETNSTNEASIPVSIDINEQNGAGETPLHTASRFYNGSGLVAALCSEPYNAKVNVQDSQGSTALIAAIKDRDSESQNILLKAEAEPSISDHLGRDALYWACLCLDEDDDIDLINKYISRIETTKSYLRALSASVATNKPAIVRILLEKLHGQTFETLNSNAKNVNFNEASGLVDRDGWTAEKIAGRYRYSEISDILSTMRIRVMVPKRNPLSLSLPVDDVDDVLSERSTSGTESMMGPKISSGWSAADLMYPLEIRADENKKSSSSSDRQTVVVVGNKPLLYQMEQPRCLVRANHCLKGEGRCYFEVEINRLETDDDDEGNGSHELKLGVGLSREEAPMDRMVGWDRGSWGYHGDDGNLFLQRGLGKSYGEKFGAGNVIGCGVDFDTGRVYFSKDGKPFGVAVSGLKGKLYPTVTFDSTMVGRSATVTFEAPFKYDFPSPPSSPQDQTPGRASRPKASLRREQLENSDGSDSDNSTWGWY